jgi:hypothetical protein
MTLKSIEERVNQLENYFKIGIVVAGLLGLSGGFLGKMVYDAHEMASEAAALASNAKAELSKASDESIAAIQRTAAATVADQAKIAIPQIAKETIEALRQEIPNSIAVSAVPPTNFGGRNNFITCATGVASGVSFGTVHSDVAASCSTLTLQRK